MEAPLLVQVELSEAAMVSAYYTLDGKVKWFLGMPITAAPGSIGQHEIDVSHASALLLAKSLSK